MNITKKAIVSFDFSTDDFFLVHAKDERFGDNGGHPMYVWTLNPRIDMSYKGKEDQIAIPEIYLSDEDAKRCENAGFVVSNEGEDVTEEELDKAVDNVLKDKDKPYFIDSKGKIQKSLFTNSVKHKQRMAWGNAFETKEQAENAKRLIHELLV